MDELAKIESVYGCVAEYNRCRWEEAHEDYEPTEEEIAEENRRMAEYNAEIKHLNGTESEFIRSLVSEWAESKPEYSEWNSEAYYKTRDWSKERTLDIVTKVTEHYGAKADEEYSTFYRVPEGKYAISVEYTDSCYIKHSHIGNLDLEQFKDIFRDLHYAGLRPTMSHKGMYVSNVSLGHLLKNYIEEA